MKRTALASAVAATLLAGTAGPATAQDAALDEIKDVCMLGEGEHRDMHERAFDTSYAWSWWDAVHSSIGQGDADVGALVG